MGEKRFESAVNPPGASSALVLVEWCARSIGGVFILCAFGAALLIVTINVILNSAADVPILPTQIIIGASILLGGVPLYLRIGLCVVLEWHKLIWELEQRSGLDLDNDRVIGQPVIKEITRPILVHAQGKISTIEGLPGGYTKDDFIEFVDGIAARGFTRAAWLQPQFRFESGRVCKRPFHDAAMAILARMDAIEGREQGSDGYLKKTAEQIINELG